MIDRAGSLWCHRAYVVSIADRLHRSLVLAGVVGVCLGVTLAGCGNDGGATASGIDKEGSIGGSVGDTGVFGSVDVKLGAGAGVHGVLPGARPGQIVDGWELHYERLLVTVGDFKAVVVDANGLPRDLGDGSVQIVDLVKLPAEGLSLREFDRVEVGTSSEVGFAIVNATTAADQTPLIGDAEYDMMVANGLSLFIEGSISKQGGETCTPGMPEECKPSERVRFSWGIKAPSVLTECDGFEIDDGRVTEVALTLPGDRWLQVDFSRASSERRAQWIADADLDRDGETTLEELEQVAAEDVFPDDQYDLARPLVPVETARDFLIAQAHAIGSAGAGTCKTGAL